MLPAVSNTSLFFLLYESEFVDLNEILPRNRTPIHTNGQRHIVLDLASNQLTTKNGTGSKDAISSFDS